MIRIRWTSAAAAAAALALGATACGGGGDEASTSTPAATTAAGITPAAAVRAVKQAGTPKPAAKPNVLGGDQDVGRTIQRLTTDAHLYFADTLAAAGAHVSQPRLAESASALPTCDGVAVTGREAPRWCEAEHTILAPVGGAEALRTAEGPAPLYVLVGWAQVRGIGSELGWHKGLADGRFTKAQVGSGEFCLFIAWLGGKFNEGIFESSDSDAIDRTVAGPAFSSVPPEVRQSAQRKGTYGGSQACVSS